jgi:protein-tyrosine phosphatase
MGVQIQINASTVVEEHKGVGKHFVQRLLKEQYVDYIGTDTHDAKMRMPMVVRCQELLIKKYGDAFARKIMRENAEGNFLCKTNETS